MQSPTYTPEEDRILLSCTADLDPDTYKDRVEEFTLRFKQASLRLPGRSVDALRKRYKRLQTGIKSEKSSDPEPSTPHCRVTATRIAETEPIQWGDEPFIRPPSIDRLMGGR